MPNGAQQTAVRLKAPDEAPLADLALALLDKGLVIEGSSSVYVLGLPLLAVQSRFVACSVESYLRYADALGLGPLPR